MHYGGVASLEKLLETQDMAGYGIFKALSRFDFPEGEPNETLEVTKIIKSGRK